VSFIYNTNYVVVKTEGGEAMSQISAVKRQLQYEPAMNGGNKTSKQETAQRNGDDGQVLLKNEVVNDV